MVVRLVIIMKRFLLLFLLVIGLTTGGHADDAPQTVGQYQVHTLDFDDSDSVEYIIVPPGEYTGGIGIDDSETWFFEYTGLNDWENGFILMRGGERFMGGVLPSTLLSTVFPDYGNIELKWDEWGGGFYYYVLEKPNGNILYIRSKSIKNGSLATYCEYPDYKTAFRESYFQNLILDNVDTTPHLGGGGGTSTTLNIVKEIT